MKSGYGFQVPSEDVDLTHVDAGTPMGELMRRYWQPIALGSEITDLPKKLKILCEEVVLFRSKTGVLGCLLPHCSHRGTSLEFGRVEERGLRCCYHGWLYSPEGKVIEMPCEPAGFCERMSIDHPSYPIVEFAGLVFVYMGPPEHKPPFPLYDVFDPATRPEYEIRGVRLWDGYGIGYVKDCNWLQAHENIVDPWHLLVLHQQISGNQFNGALMQGKSSIAFERTKLGVRYKVIKDLPNGNRMVRYAEAIVPNAYCVPNIHERGIDAKRREKCTEFSWTIPVDNEHITGLSLAAWPLEDGQPKKDWLPGTDVRIDIRPAGRMERPYEERQRFPDDREAQESQRAIAVHKLENLANSDMGVVQFRRMLRDQLKALKEGRGPINVWRDQQNGPIETHAWNTILSPAEASAHNGEEI